jgi:hypothetical protein
MAKQKKSSLPAPIQASMLEELGKVDKSDFINYYTSNMEEALHSRGEELVDERKALLAMLKELRAKLEKEKKSCAKKALTGVETKIRKAITSVGVFCTYHFRDRSSKNELEFEIGMSNTDEEAYFSIRSDGHSWMQTKPVKIKFTKAYKDLTAEVKSVDKLIAENTEEQTKVIEALGSMERFSRRAKAALSKMNLEKTEEGKAMIKMLDQDLANAGIKPARALELAGPHFS